MPVPRRLFACCLLPLLASCDSSPLKTAPGTTYGMITIGSPSVDTRERLINDRIDQQKWLEEQLAAAASADFSANASRSRRSMSALSAGANMNLDPAGMDAWRRSRGLEDSELAYKRQLADLDYQLLIRKKQLALENAQAETDPSKIEATPPADMPKTPAPSADKATQEQLVAGAGTGKGLIESMYAALAPHSDAKPISTPIDMFRDRLALREEIRNEMIANNLDDRHDLRGNALYRLSFDATVLPANDTSAYAVISVCIQPTRDFDPNASRRCDKPDANGKTVDKTGPAAAPDVSPKFTDADAHLLKRALLRDINERMQQVNEDYEEHADSKLADIEDSPGLSLETRTYFQTGAEAFLKAFDTTRGFAAEASDAPGPDPAVPRDSEKSRTEANPFTQRSQAYVMRRYHRPLIQTAERARGSAVGASFGRDFVDEVCQLKGNSIPDVPQAGMIGTDYRILEAFCTAKDFERTKAVHRYMAHLGIMLDVYERLGASNRKMSKEEFVKGHTSPLPSTALPNEETASQKARSVIMYGADGVKLYLNAEALIKDLKRENLELYAYGGTPRESVERIADVVTRREAFQLALGLQTLAGNAGISALTNYMKGSEGVFAALRRQPLVVGFGHSNAHMVNSDHEPMPPADFGWVIGPRYGTASDGTHANFRQSVVQHGLSAVVSVPGWWDRVELVVRRYWVDEAGNILGTAKPHTSASYLQDDNLRYTISLPESIDSILSLLESKPRMAPEPHRLDQALWTVKNGAPAEIMIRGAHLWRNPQVRLGGQLATNIRVLPDMRGIVAEFAKVDKDIGGGPALRNIPKSLAANSLPVTLTTTNGFRMVGFATVVADGPKAEGLRATGPALLFGGEANSFKLNAPLPGYYAISSISRRAGTSNAFTSEANGWGSKSDRELAYTPKKLATNVTGTPVEMQLLLQRKKGEEPDRVPVSGKLIYYSNKASWRVQGKSSPPSKVEIDGQDMLTYQITLTLPPAYEEAMDLKDKTAVFETTDLPLTSSLTCQIKEVKNTLPCSFSITVPESARGKQITLRPAGKPDNVPAPSMDPIKLQ